ncbi:MAG: hypothetical protein ACR2OU_20525 [Thermomicrobiales bacterium]
MEIITSTIVIPHDLDAQTALERLRDADADARANPHWLVPDALVITWAETVAAITGVAFGFHVTGEIEASDADVRICLHIPWTAKALVTNFAPTLESHLTNILV